MPYIGKTTDGFGVRNRFVYLASNGATSVSGADANGATLTFTDGAYVDVYLNGVLLKPTTDYNTSTANTIAGLSALNTNDEVTVVVYDVFTVADTVSATSGGTFSGNVTFNGDISVGDDISLASDGAVLGFGADNEITVTHVADTGLRFEDSDKLLFGAGADLEIYHDGSNSYIDESGTGSLFIRSSRVSIHKYTGETMINAAADSAVSLYYDDSKKLETTANGIVVGGVTAETQQSGMKTVQVGARGFLTPYDSGAVYLNSNIFYNASSQWEYATNGYGNVLALNDGALYYYRVASGSDGDVNPTLTQSFLSDRDGAFFVYANHNGDVASIIQNSASTPYGIDSKFNSAAPDNTTSWFYNASDSSATRFRVYSDGDVVNHDDSYGALSDERIKQDIVDANSQWDDIKAIRVRNFKKKDDVIQYGDKAWTQIGVIAQELEKVSPKLIKEATPNANDIRHSAEFGTLYTKDDKETQDAVLYTKDDKEVKNGSQKVGDIKTPSTKQIGDVKEIKDKVKRVSTSVLYMKAVKALQEAMARIETLEAKVKALEEA